MTTPFELRSRAQFGGIDQLQRQWEACQKEDAARAKYDHLTGTLWAQENCGLEEAVAPTLEQIRPLFQENHLETARALIAIAQTHKTPTCADLLKFHFQLMKGIHPEAGNYRLDDTPSDDNSKSAIPPEAALVPALVDNALSWFEAASFQEIHPIEKTALVLIKLLDLQPFAAGNGVTLRLFSNFYLLNAGYPPAVIAASEAGAYAESVVRAMRFETQPLVSLLVKAIQYSFHAGLGL
jgi:Fic family protein